MNKISTKSISLKFPAAATFAALFAYAAVLTMPQSSINELSLEFRVSNSVLGGMFSFFVIGFLIAAVGGGRLSDRLGKLPMVVLGCVMMAAGMLIFLKASSFAILTYGALLAGLGGGLAEVVATALISDIYQGPTRTAMMNWAQVVFSAGAVAMPLIFAQMLSVGIYWRKGYAFAAILSIICALIAASAFAAKPIKTSSDDHQNVSWRSIIRNRFVLKLSFCLLLYVGSEIGLSSWIAAYLKKDLMSSAPIAAMTVAIFWVGIGSGRIAAAGLSKRLSDKMLICWPLGLGALFQALLLLVHAPVIALALVFCTGFCLGPTWPTVISRAGGAFPADSGAVIGIVAAFGCIGAAIVPRMIGWISDMTDLRTALWICVAALLLGLAIINVGKEKAGGDA